MKNSEQLRTLTNAEITDFVKTQKTYRHISTNLPVLKDEIIKRTNFLDIFYQREITFTTRVKCFRDSIFSIDSIPDCTVCGENKVIFLRQNGEFSEACSSECAHEISHRKTIEYNRKNHDCDYQWQREDVKEKTEQTNMKRIQVRRPLQSKAVQKKRRATCRRKYGEDHHMKVPAFSSSVTETNFGLYGASRYIHSEEYKEKKKQQNIEEFGWEYINQKHLPVEIFTNKEEFEKILEGKSLKEVGIELGVDKKTVGKYVLINGINRESKHNSSYGETQVFDFIKSIIPDTVIRNDRSVLNGSELDVMIPSKNLAIEYNGIYYHSDAIRPNDYHLAKTLRCAENGIRLIHIFEDEWFYRKDQVKGKLKHVLGVDDRKTVYARRCELITLKNSEVAGFYEQNHIQGHVAGSVVIGLTCDGELVAAMSFKKTRGYMELVRYATSMKVVGGFSRLVKFFCKSNTDKETIFSFADVRWSDGSMYSANGWIHEYTTSPDYTYVSGDKRIRKGQFRKEKIAKKYPSVYSPEKTEKEMMKEIGFKRIYDCGLMKYSYKNPWYKNG